MTYFIASDHAGVELKKFIVELLQNQGFTIQDMGPFNNSRVDYPDFAKKVCLEVQQDNDSQGILICGSGIGMSMSANKFQNIRAALCHNEYSAKMAREHNDANILCLGERVCGLGMIENIIDAWNNSKFQGNRHTNRVNKIDNLYSSCRTNA